MIHEKLFLNGQDFKTKVLNSTLPVLIMMVASNDPDASYFTNYLASINRLEEELCTQYKIFAIDRSTVANMSLMRSHITSNQSGNCNLINQGSLIRVWRNPVLELLIKELRDFDFSLERNYIPDAGFVSDYYTSLYTNIYLSTTSTTGISWSIG